MKSTYRIVTKSRYGLLRLCLLWVLFTIEYWICMWDFSEVNLAKHIFAFIGYMLLQVMFVFRTHSQRVYLRYEFALSLLIKCVMVDMVAGVFFLATDLYTDMSLFFLRMFLMICYNLLSIFGVLVIINYVARLKNPKPERILYVKADDSMEQVDLKKYDAVYLFDIPAQQRNDWLKLCYEKDITVYTTAKLSDILMRSSGIAQDRDRPVFYCTKFGLGTAMSILKRCLDVICCVIALLVLWPVMLLTAIAIKIEDKGPVFYSQVRCTKDLKEFRIYKFRSMMENSEASSGIRLSSDEDDRVTRVGRFIRKWKIDELPQIFNILKGDMSVVGPRPERPELIEKNCKEVPEFVLRTKVKAGLTGYAQIRGLYDTDKLDKLKWDLMYIENYSILLDVKIIIITAVMLLQRKF